jgi:hypothetical protein
MTSWIKGISTSLNIGKAVNTDIVCADLVTKDFDNDLGINFQTNYYSSMEMPVIGF